MCDSYLYMMFFLKKKKKKKKFMYDVWTSDEKDEFYGSDPKDLEANNN